jgi:hypothetical protein
MMLVLNVRQEWKNVNNVQTLLIALFAKTTGVLKMENVWNVHNGYLTVKNVMDLSKTVPHAKMHIFIKIKSA